MYLIYSYYTLYLTIEFDYQDKQDLFYPNASGRVRRPWVERSECCKFLSYYSYSYIALSVTHVLDTKLVPFVHDSKYAIG